MRYWEIDEARISQRLYIIRFKIAQFEEDTYLVKPGHIKDLYKPLTETIIGYLKKSQFP
jgi:hypothetical protein